jgi:Rha family phage regulatory protein
MAENTVSQNTLAVKVSGIISIEFVREDTPAVLSTEVALRFQKKHKHVLDEIKRIQSITPKSFSEPNFRPATYPDEQGKPRPAFLLTRDAFSLLAMGFTGKNAIQWKLRYIEACNTLEAAVLDNARAAALEEGKTLALEEGGRELIAKGAQLALSLSLQRFATLNNVLKYRRLGLTPTEIGKLLDLGLGSIGEYTGMARRMGLLPPAPLTEAQQRSLRKGRTTLRAKKAAKISKEAGRELLKIAREAARA